MSDIKLCRLVTGETVVGEENGELIKNILGLHAMPNPQQPQQVNMSITPYWIPFSRENADIEKRHCVSIIPADAELASQYRQITSGITMATPSDLKNMTQGGPGPIPFPKG